MSPILDLDPYIHTLCRARSHVVTDRVLQDNQPLSCVSETIFLEAVVTSENNPIFHHKTLEHKYNYNCIIINEKLSVTLRDGQLDNTKLVVIAFSQGLGHEKKEIGRCCLGPKEHASGSALYHWNEMLRLQHRYQYSIKTHFLFNNSETKVLVTTAKRRNKRFCPCCNRVL